MVNINNVGSIRQNWPNWNQRGRVRKVDEHGNVLADQFAFNGEVVRISPRYLKSGVHFRVRPERPAAFFAAFCKERELLPTLLTPEECQEEWTLILLDPLWEGCKHLFHKLESPNAACDSATAPSHRNGFSFNLMQVLVEPLGSLKPVASKLHGVLPGSVPTTAGALEAARAKIAEMRGKAASGRKKN